MKKVIALAALTALASSALAQLSPVPPAGAVPLNIPGTGNAIADSNAALWGSSVLSQYVFASDANLNTPQPGTPDNKAGLNWGATHNAHVASIMDSMNATGGTVRVMFLGESARWLNDFGFSYDGNPASAESFSIWNNIQAVGGSGITAFEYADIGLSIGEASSFDLWLNGANSFYENNPAPGAPGGYYTPFHPANSSPYIANGNIRWTQDSLGVMTDLGGVLGQQLAATYMIGFEDYNLNGSDKDFNDFMVAVQFFRADGTPFSPVPEPSTYGLIGAAALLGLVARRRFAKKK